MLRQGERATLQHQNAVIAWLDRRPRWPAPLEQILGERQTERPAANDDGVKGATRLCFAKGVADVSSENVVGKVGVFRRNGHGTTPHSCRKATTATPWNAVSRHQALRQAVRSKVADNGILLQSAMVWPTH